MSQSSQKRPRRTLSRKKRLLFAMLITLGVLCLAVACGEVIMRCRRVALTARLRAALGESGDHTGWAVFDESLHYRNRPNWSDHNSHGMRDDPIGPKDRFRILLLGDSLGYEGTSIEDTYPDRIETLLNANAKLAPSELLNTSTKGYTNFQELVYLKQYGLAFSPDLVLLAFCVNDLHKYLHQFDMVDGDIVANTYAFTAGAGASSSPEFLAPSLCLTWVWRKGAAASTRLGLRSGTIFECRPDISTAWQDESWSIFESQIEEMKTLCEPQQIPLVLMAFPHAEQYRASYLQQDRKYVLKPQRKLALLCQRLGLAYLDLYKSLKPEHFQPDGIHLTAEGRASAAESVAEFLDEAELIPKLATGLHD